MAAFWGKAMTRKAEALEQLERWEDAEKVWKECAEAGVGGNTSIQGRNRCKKAAAGSGSLQGDFAAHKPQPATRRPPKPKSSVIQDLSGKQGATIISSTEAVNRLRAANAQAERVDDEKFALADCVDERLTKWRKGKEGNLRALLGSLDTVLWEGAGWKKVGMGELIVPGKVKVAYMKGISKVHPDKAVIDTVEDLSSTADEATRKKIITALRDLAYSIESPDDTMGRIMFLVSLLLFDTVGPQFQELPSFLARNRYQNITDSTKTVFQDAWKTELPTFLWLPQHPEAFTHLNQHMAARRKGMPTWLSVYPVEQDTKAWKSEAPVYVDIGGGIGHQCAEFKAKYPNLPGRVILQDLSYSIDNALSTPGVENMVHDFFQPQPVQEAKFYYMRGILHDFPDDKCRLILQNTIGAMGKDSLILIDDMVLPDTNAHWQATQVDLTMMSALASMERTQIQWQALLKSIGLKIIKTYVYTPGLYESVIVTVPE
ncbi:MAG: hypothetical protein Q9187_006587 [Circinaria calcarea]